MARTRFSHLHKVIAAPLGFALGAAFFAGVVAQEAPADVNTGGRDGDSSDVVVDVVETTIPTISTNADGAFVESTSGVNPVAEGGGGTLVYGDITGGVPPVPIVNSPAPAAPGAVPAPEPEPAPAPNPEPAPAPAGGEPVAPPTTSAGDQDGDNLNDADEPALGLDPNNIDTDGDFIDDGYELNGLGTSPTTFDTDGDGIGDGEEVYGIFTDPLVPNSGGSAPPAPQPAAELAPASISGADGPVSATEGDVTTFGPGVGEASPGTINDSPAVGQVVPLAAPLAPIGTTCSSFGSWLESQLAFEAGDLGLDPDGNGIACEEFM